MNRFKLSAIACAVLSAVSMRADAYEKVLLKDALGTPFIELRIFSMTDGPFENMAPASTWNLSERDKSQIFAGINYWSNVLKITPGKAPALIHLGTIDDNNAFAGSELVKSVASSKTQVQAKLQNYPTDTLTGADGIIVIGKMNFSNEPYIPSQVPLSGWQADLAATVTHEVAHALGILGEIRDASTVSGTYAPFFGQPMSDWALGLRDDNGKAAQAGQVIWCSLCVNPAGDVFDVRLNQAYFSGQHVDDVMAGAMRGVPVSMLDDDGHVDKNYLAHIELKNSMMSHQRYSNYTTFMEAELAVLQDMGYTIDRRNFFGSSVYGSGLTLINDNAYFQRNADGTAYLSNTYNPMTLGLGLHVYGSNNTLYQRADLLSSGAGGAGIRVDGVGNSITVLPEARVHANGDFARAIMFTYGKNHYLAHRGDAQALGDMGIAASFDFGSNNLSNQVDYRGSYIYETNGTAMPLLPELDGPLVNSVDLTGSLAGRYAAIYISENAYVGQINVMQGASLTGDIHSFYNEVDGNGDKRLTALTFGLAADADGQSTGQADTEFQFLYNGNIVGINNFTLQPLGGLTELNGNHHLYSANIAQGATLAGNSQYTLNNAGTFANDGTFAIGKNGNTTITGNYVQSATGVLQAGISGDNTLHNLQVNGNATIDGTLAIAPQRSWFADGAQFVSSQWIDATNLTGSFSGVTTALDSPTLTATATDLGNNSYSVTINRQANAYSQYANTTTGSQIGAALDAVGSANGTGMQALFAALDFSATDGSQIQSAFNQLSPATYSEMFHGSLLRERRISQLVTGAAQNSDKTVTNTHWNTFATPFGSYYRHSANGNAVGSNGNTYGVVFGGERAQDTWTLGVHGAVTGQSTRVGGESVASGKSTGMDIGTHARFSINPYQGAHAFALARLGVDDTTFDRTVSVNGYTGKSTGKWTGVSATTAIGGGWRIQTGETSSIGPIAGLDYTVLHRPDVTESGSGANLRLDKKTFSSLRAHVGGEWQSTFNTAAGKQLTTNMKAAWHHELRDTTMHQAASFAGAPANQFGSNNAVMAKDSLSVEANLSYQVKQAMSVNAGIAATVWKGGDAEFAGTVSVKWKF